MQHLPHSKLKQVDNIFNFHNLYILYLIAHFTSCITGHAHVTPVTYKDQRPFTCSLYF